MPPLLNQPLESSLLEKTRRETEKRVPPAFQKGFRQIVAAGLQLMFSEQTFKDTAQYIRTITNPAQIPMVVAHGIVKAISVIHRESQGKMPIEPAGAAAVVLMTHGLDYVETVMKLPVSADVLAKTTDLVSQGMVELLGQMSGLSPQDMADIKAGRAKEVLARAQARESAGGAAPGATPGAAPAGPPVAPGASPTAAMPPTGGM